MKISILVPWRSDGPDGHRQKLWDYLRPRWERTPFEICVGEDDVYAPLPTIEGPEPETELRTATPLPFNCSQALNRAARMADGDVFVMMGADHYPNESAILAAAERATHWPGWSPVYRTTNYLSEASTAALIAGERGIRGLPFERTDPTCMGITAVHREAWLAVHGMDERYRGWGWEDTDLRRRLTQKFGDAHPMPLTSAAVVALWHDMSHRDLSYDNPNRRRFEAGQ